ncbi:Serine/Threonine kinase domain protein (macronuclear) [Tetrahymena thermophila SB210]|uniref:Serine/Threonine kinase domain protein n=1 Tax=Tetrahymena thermophila (strain SB210) TaxID=312017 RepID=I7LVY6_TETTS|nr:Serine/Threonine kinase domain protein [Tetrahymena thermophila SB210]EAS00348.2 Serine/Threonine kinase domain protein [Tetrahymena thermophila SB210]|eukprot:XP_001020593.2 Serine/Threonine kinase domain protein [Tetrahymena thermophila SB210]
MQNDSLKGLVGWSGGQKKGGHTSSFKLFDRSQNFKKKEKKGEGGHSIVKKCSIYLIDTMKRCNQEFKFDQSLIPRRFLTVPNEGVSNNNYDNEQSDYIMRVKDIIYNDQRKIEYIIEDMLGKGTFGQVAKCSKNGTNDLFAVKVIKNRPAYFQQAKNEILLLRVLNKQEEQNGENYQKRIVNLVDFFVFRNHFCLVFEMLELSLYDYLKNTKFCGFSFSVIAQWTKSILEGMVIAESKQIIHCDLKPENIMLKNNQLKIIDFGSACHQDKRIFTYIQSRFYRAPEVILGMIYTTAIDMWSLGCILVELFLGLPIFPGNSEYDQIKRIIDILGKPTNEVIEQGRFKNKFFKCLDGEYIFKTKQEFEISEGIQLKESKTYFQVACLNDLKNYMYNSQFRRNEDDTKNNRQFDLFLDLATQLLELNPRKRVKASIAMQHPFLNQDENNFYSSLTNQKIENTKEFSLDQSTSDERHNDIKQQQQQSNQNTDFNLFKVSDQNAAIVKKAIQNQKENQEKLKPNQLTSDPQQQQINNLLSGQQQIGQEQNLQSQYYLNQYPLQQQQGQYQNDPYNFHTQQPGIQQIPFNQSFTQQPQIYNNYLNQNMYQYPYQFQQQQYAQQMSQMLPQQQQPVQQSTFPYQQPYNQVQQQQQMSTDQLANLFSQQLNLQTSNQFQNQKQSFRNQKQSKKCLSQQDSLDYQKEFYDDYPNQFQNNQIQDKNMWSTNQFTNIQNQGNFYKNSNYNYQKTGTNQGFQQGISNIENIQDQQVPPANIKDIFDNVDDNFPKQQLNQQPQQLIHLQNYQQGNQQQMPQGFLLNSQYIQNFYNPQQQLGMNIGNLQPNNNLLGNQFQVQDQPQQQNQQYQLFQQQFNQQNYGFNQFNNQQNMRQNYQLFNQNNLQQNLFLQNQQYYQQQQQQLQQQQQPLNQQNSQFPQQTNQQQTYYNKPYQNQKQNNKYKNSSNGKNSNNNTKQADMNANNNFNNNNNNNNSNNSQKFYQNNKKFRRHYSDSEFQQYQPEQNEIFNDIKAPFLESDQIENQSQNLGKSSDNIQEDNKQERHGEESASNNSSNFNNNSNNTGNQKQNQNFKRQNSNYNNNQNYSNQKNQQKFKKPNQGQAQQQQQHNNTFNSNSNNNNYSQNFPNQNTQFQANLSNNNNNSNSSSNNNNNNSSILNNNSSNQGQIQTQNMKTSQQNNNNSNNSNDQQNQHNPQDNNNNFKKGQNKFKNQNKKSFTNHKYQQQNAQQQQFSQGQKQYSPINENPSQS